MKNYLKLYQSWITEEHAELSFLLNKQSNLFTDYTIRCPNLLHIVLHRKFNAK